MVTEKTLQAKINEYKNITAQISELEKSKKALSDYIMQEYDSRNIDTFHGLKIISSSRETIKKESVPAAIWERFKTVSEYRYLRKCKA